MRMSTFSTKAWFATTGRVRRLGQLFSRSVFMLLVAGLAGLIAAWSARQHIQGRVQQLEEQSRVPMVGRIVAAGDLPVGTRLSEDHLAVRQFPRGTVSSESLAPERFASLVGTVLRGPVAGGDPILPVHTQAPDRDAFSSQIALGRRAITMPVDRINSVSGLLQPGDMIDLYVSFEYQRRTITAPLLQGVMVLATDTRTQYDDGAGGESSHYTTVTLDAAPEDAVKLVAARHAGSLTAVLRPANDHQATTRAVRGDLASLLGIHRAPPRRTDAAPVIYGNTQSRRVPQLAPSPSQSQPSGLINLPEAPPLVSAWVHSSAPTLADSPTEAP